MAYGRAGSSPALGTIIKGKQSFPFFVCVEALYSLVDVDPGKLNDYNRAILKPVDV